MFTRYFVLAAAFSSTLVAAQNTSTGLPLGAECDPKVPNVCANGVECWASNAMLQTRCGNYNAACKTDADCAYHTCNNGLCNGLQPSSATSLPSTSSTPSLPKPTGTNLPLGADCDPAVPSQCANGVNCYATNSMLIPRCGNFQSSCTSDAQCAFNTCNNGLCNGFLSTTSRPTDSSTTSVPGSMSSASTTSVSSFPKPTGTNLALGANCDPAIPNACANGVNCYATNSMLMPRCGNFQATCTNNSQCAFNTCNNGACNGFLPSSAYPAGSASSSASPSSAPTTASSSVLTTSRPAPSTVVPSSQVTYIIETAPNGTPAPPVTLTTVVPGANQGSQSTSTRAAASTSPILQANSGSRMEGGVVGVAGLVFAALML